MPGLNQNDFRTLMKTPRPDRYAAKPASGCARMHGSPHPVHVAQKKKKKAALRQGETLQSAADGCEKQQQPPTTSCPTLP